MLLSNVAIRRHMQLGSIVIDPFKPENLGTASYDVTLGKWYYRERLARRGPAILNPYDEQSVLHCWVLNEALPAYEYRGVFGDEPFVGIPDDALVIPVKPGETILAHTEEFVGGVARVNAMMKTRSSLARNFIDVCGSAGWGDVGYVNRWTMEITNFSRCNRVLLVVGRRIAQIVFFECEEIVGASYGKNGKYQANVEDVEELRRRWRPEMMLPQMHRDREAQCACSQLAGKR